MKNMVKLVLVAMLAISQAVFALPDEAASVNVNTAEPALLAELLDGVGTARAQAIVDYREEFGEFASIDDLLDVRGIGPHVIEANRDKIAISD